MSELDNALEAALASIPECMAAGFIDLSSGMLLGIRSVDSQPYTVLELLAAATGDLFQSAGIRAIEGLFKEARGQARDERHYFQEIVASSDNVIHLFLRATQQDYAACFVCRKSVNLGMALTRARGSVGALEALL